MPFEALVGLQVDDNETYDKYRAAMGPLLANYDGGFRYDFHVSEVLKNEAGAPINRVFCIYFRDEAGMDAFFGDPAYVESKERFFAPSVSSTTIIATYER